MKVVYKWELPSSTSIHHVFHISKLRQAQGTHHFSPTLPLQLSLGLRLLMEPQQLLGLRAKAQGSSGDLEVLLRWKNFTNYEVTWEDFDLVRQQFPSFHLKEKVKVWARY